MTYRRWASATVLLLMSCAGRRESVPPATSKQSIFRAVQIHSGEWIALGSRFSAYSESEAVNDSLFRMKQGHFTRAEEISVLVLPDRRVYALEFLYPAGTHYEKKISSYERFLGQPTAGGNVEGGGEWTYWQDRRTRFTVSRDPDGEGEGDRVRSRITDLELAAP